MKLCGLLVAWLPVIVGTATTGCVIGEQVELSHNGFDDLADRDDSQADPGRMLHRFSDRRLFPAGGAFDAQTAAFYVGSLSHGNVTRVTSDGREQILFAGTGEPDRATLGVQVDSARRQLWVCTMRASRGRVWLFDLVTDARIADIDLATANPTAGCSDLAIDRDGSVLVGDSGNPMIYRIDNATRTVSRWAEHPLLKGRAVSVTALDFTEDHSAVLAATFARPSLVRIDARNPRDVRAVALGGDPFVDPANKLNGPNDLVVYKGQLLVAFGSTFKRVEPTDASWSAATVSSTLTIGGVTTIVHDGDRLFAINGQAVRFELELDPLPFEIFEVFLAKLR